MTTTPKPPARKPKSRADAVVQAALEALSMPQKDFDEKLEAFETERDRKAQEALKKLKK